MCYPLTSEVILPLSLSIFFAACVPTKSSPNCMLCEIRWRNHTGGGGGNGGGRIAGRGHPTALDAILRAAAGRRRPVVRAAAMAALGELALRGEARAVAALLADARHVRAAALFPAAAALPHPASTALAALAALTSLRSLRTCPSHRRHRSRSPRRSLRSCRPSRSLRSHLCHRSRRPRRSLRPRRPRRSRRSRRSHRWRRRRFVPRAVTAALCFAVRAASSVPLSVSIRSHPPTRPSD